MFVIYDELSKQYAVAINGTWSLTPNIAQAHQWVLALIAEEIAVTSYRSPQYQAVVLPYPPPAPPAPAVA